MREDKVYLININQAYCDLSASGELDNIFLYELEKDIAFRLNELGITYTNDDISDEIKKLVLIMIRHGLEDVLNGQVMRMLKKGPEALNAFIADNESVKDLTLLVFLLDGRSLKEYVEDKDYFFGYRKRAVTRVSESATDSYHRRKIIRDIAEVNEPTIDIALHDLMSSITCNDCCGRLLDINNISHDTYEVWSVDVYGKSGTIKVVSYGDYRIIEWERTFMKEGKYVGNFMF